MRRSSQEPVQAPLPVGASGWFRAGLAFLAVSAAVTGIGALFAPRSFFDDFPGFGHAWVALLPPYNEHLTRDTGAFYLSFAVLFVWAIASPDRRLTRAILAAYLVYAVPHFSYHFTHLMHFPPADAVAQTAALAALIVVPLMLLIPTRPTRRDGGNAAATTSV